METKKVCVLMVSDFFTPRLGGVESHIVNLSGALISSGNYRVIGLTPSLSNRREGIRFLKNGMKVYYLPFPTPISDVVTFPSIVNLLPFLREIIYREKVDIVHGHQATSNCALECLMHSRLLGCRTVYTDHSLFNLSDLGGMHVNKLLQVLVSPCHRAICVSHTTRENLALRAYLDPAKIFVIPNALDTHQFTPLPDEPSLGKPSAKTVVVLSRLTQRKGTSLLVKVIPIICSNRSDVNFVIGGDGPLRLDLEEMIDRFRLNQRITLLGSIPFEDVGRVLRKGQFFLNCSLTEAFCIAIVEAACMGLRVVTTNVGGIPEVLPPHLMRMSPPEPDALAAALLEELKLPPQLPPLEMHRQVAEMYTWKKIAQRTAVVYDTIMSERPYSLAEQLKITYDCGPIFGKVWALVLLLDALLVAFLEWYRPAKSIPRGLK